MKRILTTLAVIAVAAFGVAKVASSDSSPGAAPPSIPAWAHDVTKMPAFVHASDAHGQLVRCADGKPLEIPKAMLLATPPDVGSAEWRAQAVNGNNSVLTHRAQRIVCGANDQAKWVVSG